MPVLVTSAHRSLERRLVLRLLEEGGEVRAYSHGDTSVLRAAGAFVASGTPDDEGRLDAACTDVHTVVHVGAGLFAEDPERLVRDVEVLLRAVAEAQVRRVIAVSLPGAALTADDPIRRAMGEVERRLEEAAVPTVVIRASLVTTPGLVDALATIGVDPEVERIPVAAVRAEDLLELIVAFDEARSRSTSGHLVVAADGPERITVAELMRRLGVSSPGQGGLVGRRLPPAWLEDRLDTALRGPWWTDDPVVPDGWRFAGFTPGPISGPGGARHPEQRG